MEKVGYIISDIDKSVNFEATALALREAGIIPVFFLINCKNGALEHFLRTQQFEVCSIEVASIRRSFSAIRACVRQLKTWKVTTIHCHLALANWIGLLAAWYCGIPKRIFTRHSGEPLQLHWKEKWIDRIQNKCATHIVSISVIIDQLLEKQGVPATKRVLIHHGFDIQRFQFPNNNEVQRLRKLYNPHTQAPVIGVIARWMEWKGVHFVIGAFTMLLDTYPNARLLLFGGHDHADFSAEIRQLVNKLPESSVEVIPFEQNVYDLYQLFDVYVHVPVNNTCEAFGQTYIETLAAGIPSVVTLSGIANELVSDGRNALVVPYQNAPAIEQAIGKLLENHQLREQLIRTGQHDVSEAFSFAHFTKQLVDLYCGKSIPDSKTKAR